jgi:hypothetical protein
MTFRVANHSFQQALAEHQLFHAVTFEITLGEADTD